LVKHAYNKAGREDGSVKKRAIGQIEGYLLNVVVPAAPGSFRIRLAAAHQSDMYGENALLAKAFERVDQFFDINSKTKETIALVKQQRGHLAGAYLRLLKSLVSHKTSMSYTWAEPSHTCTRHGRITQAEAASLVEALSGVSNIGSETLTILGTLEKADRETGSWKLKKDDGEDYSGRLHEDGPSLEGLKIGGSYQFVCSERYELIEIGRETRTLYLLEYEPI
jgi:hypothetical protein